MFEFIIVWASGLVVHSDRQWQSEQEAALVAAQAVEDLHAYNVWERVKQVQVCPVGHRS